MDKVRWGIIGAGRIAHSFAKDIAFVNNAEVIAVAARQLKSAEEFAGQYAIPKAFGSYDELFSDSDVDAVYIATPHNLHAEQCIAALRAGKHILCEKPVTVTPAELEEVLAVAKACNRYFMEAMWTYFLPAIQKAQEWIAAGRIGSIRQLKADFGYPLPYDPARREYDAALAGGCLLEMGVYPVAIASLFITRPLLGHYSSVKFAPNGVEQDVVSVFSYADCLATIASSFSAKLQNWAYIIGEKGYIAIPDFWRASSCYLYQLDEQVNAFEDGRKTLGFDYEIAAASADILAGQLESSVVSHKHSREFQTRMELIKREWKNF